MHRGLVPFAPGLHLAAGPQVEGAAGFRFPTRMAVARLSDGGLFVWSPVALTDGLRHAVDALGPVRHLVAPNRLHHAFLSEWRAAYPDAVLYAAPGLAAKRPDLAFDAELGAEPAPGWDGDIDQALIGGNLIATEIVFFHRQSATVLVCDLLQNMEESRFTGWRRLVARLDRMTGPAPAMPRKFRAAFLRPSAARDGVRRLLAWPAERLVVAHGTPVERNAARILQRRFCWLA
ncbi:DUF4336 domain-containing protein [Roseivivax sediminis]|uniref:DUF4336 domain-containing protein n=1 Tax=Roseivivax sediminis TaxID=936889 RepID=A0A1I1UUV0_9RHOB|nr:DUF4336 domain-containing protein [Roseivivax sediminis]SFD73448.1 protein of unknown function [Roseivivax sediminis]